jgi:erythromycin esterase-like protein
MNDNLQWVLEREQARGRVILFAHNLHVARTPIAGPMVIERKGKAQQIQTLGQLLHRALGNAYVPIGTAFGQSRDEDKSRLLLPRLDSVDAALSRVGHPLFFLRLKGAQIPEDAKAWLESPHLIAVGSKYAEMNLRDAFDAVVFVEKVRHSGGQ